MTPTIHGPAWMPPKIIYLHNQSDQNVHVHMNTGTYRLDAHRSMKFVATVLDYPQVKALIDEGVLTWEKL
ncbi:MAG: hypothetical protein HZY76_18000 [Anaerolineae bacterium]|nr:MAG: hypothetical protein HZY76_18000 [Anaerolineae bacterium]